MKNIAVGDLIRVDYEKDKRKTYWRERNEGVPAGIHGTRISEFDDDMKMTFVPCDTILLVLGVSLDVRKALDEDSDFPWIRDFLVLDPAGQFLWIEEMFIEKYQPTSKENSSDVTV